MPWIRLVRKWFIGPKNYHPNREPDDKSFDFSGVFP